MNFRPLEHRQITQEQRIFPVCLVADGIRSAENTGLIFRTAEAFGVRKIFFTGELPPIHSHRASKAARSALDWLPWEHVEQANVLADFLKEHNYTCIGLEITAESTDIRYFNFRQYEKIAMIIGNERHGISPAWQRLLDTCVHITLFGRNTSLNVAVAAGIALHCVADQFYKPNL